MKWVNAVVDFLFFELVVVMLVILGYLAVAWHG